MVHKFDERPTQELTVGTNIHGELFFTICWQTDEEDYKSITLSRKDSKKLAKTIKKLMKEE